MMCHVLVAVEVMWEHFILTHTCTKTLTHTHTHTHTHAHTHIHTTCPCMHTHTHTHTHTYCTCMHTHTHTHLVLIAHVVLVALLHHLSLPALLLKSLLDELGHLTLLAWLLTANQKPAYREVGHK